MDERHGAFDSETRFIVQGGNSAAKIHGGQTDFQKSPYFYNHFSDEDVILDRTFGVDARFDGRYYNMGALPLEKGFAQLMVVEDSSLLHLESRATMETFSILYFHMTLTTK